MDAQAETFWKQLELLGSAQCNEAMLARTADAVWKAATAPDAGSSTTATQAAPSRQIEIGRSMLSDTERWKLQAALRREETKVGGKEYNKKVTRATKTTKGPTPGEGFPPGRGRPVR